MIIDASVVIDAVADPGIRGDAARRSLADHPAFEPMIAPGHFAFEIMSGLRAAANRPRHPLRSDQIEQALVDAEAFEIEIRGVRWADVHRAWALTEALRYADAIYIATAERLGLTLLTSDTRIERSGARVSCPVLTIRAP
jgi:predicted nucleic acid-binding protein